MPARIGRGWIAPSELALLNLIAYAPTLAYGFVDWDDPKNYLNNPHLQHPGWRDIVWAWTTPHVGVYQPLGWLILEAQAAVWGLAPLGYRIVGLSLQIANCIVLYDLTVALIGRIRGPDVDGKSGLTAALAIALFAVHPLRVEVVAWLSCQTHLSGALLALLSIGAYLRAHPPEEDRRRSWSVVAWLLFAASLLIRPSTLGLPLVLLVLDVVLLGRGPEARRALIEKLPFVALSILALVPALPARTLHPAVAGRATGGIAGGVARVAYAITAPLASTIAPFGLTAYYPVPDRPAPGSPPFLGSILFVAGLTTLAILSRHRWPGLLAAWVAYLALLAPALRPTPLEPYITADRYSYLATVPWFVLLAVEVVRLRLHHPRMAAVARAIGFGLVLILLPLTWRQNQTWRDSESLWRNVLAQGGDDSLTRLNLGMALLRQGRHSEAADQFRAAIQLRPDEQAAPRARLGLTLALQGRLAEAIAQLHEAATLDPKLPEPHPYLGLIFDRQGKIDLAIAQLYEALRLQPDSPTARAALQRLLQRRPEPANSSPIRSLNPPDPRRRPASL